MENLFFALWRHPGRRAQQPQDLWLDPPPLGLGRLVAALAIIGVAVCLLDHAAAVISKADSIAVASYGSSQKGN
ncbi:conserved hypothetical protein [Mesorhizobium sp. ORS 3324]|nr:conserved hypothetical protein [Mesorhizobium sp. ORS 3324]